MSAGSRAIAAHVATLLLVALAYLIIRIGLAPTHGVLRNHATDLLAGVALPALLALVFASGTPLGAWVRALRGKLATVLAAALVWEVAVPLTSARSTPDLLDVACYVAGALLQHLASLLTRSSRAAPRSTTCAAPR